MTKRLLHPAIGPCKSTDDKGAVLRTTTAHPAHRPTAALEFRAAHPLQRCRYAVATPLAPSGDIFMKILSTITVAAALLLGGCISSSSPPAPQKSTTVIVPQGSGTTVVCQDGTHPPCN